MENYTKIIKSIIEEQLDDQLYHERGIVQPIYWSEDDNGNINFDVDSIRDEFERLLTALEEYNETSDFGEDDL